MKQKHEALPADFPANLRRSDADTPVPTWRQITRSTSSLNKDMIANVSRIVANTNDEQQAMREWDSWPSNYRRSVALLIDKIRYEGWLDAVGHINGYPWDGGFYFTPSEPNAVSNILTAKGIDEGSYIECAISHGLFAFLNSWNHKDWVRGWMETDSANAALHVGVREDGSSEVHLEAFNPLFTKGAPSRDIAAIGALGSFNYRQFVLHRRWEQSNYAGSSRTSANFYHMMTGKAPLSF